MPIPSRLKTSLRRLLTPTLWFTLLLCLRWYAWPRTAQALIGVVAWPQEVLVFGLELGLWLCGALLVSRLLALLLWDGLFYRAFAGGVPQYLSDVVNGLVFIVAVALMLVHTLGLPVTGVWATSGMIGIVLGVALRNIILDLFTGLTLNIERPFVLGDWVAVQDRLSSQTLAGFVRQINWRTTRIVTRDNISVVVPNNFFGERIVSNYSQPTPPARFALRLSLDFSVPVERASRVLLAGVQGAVGQSRGPIASPPPDVLVSGITAAGIEYLIRYWILPTVVSEQEASNAVWRSVLHHLQHAGLTLTYPRYDVFHARMPVDQREPHTPVVRQLLTLNELFHNLQADELDLLAATALPQRFAAGDTLVRQGDPGDSLFLLAEGLLQVSVAGPTAEESPVAVARLQPGDIFGEISVLTSEPRTATVTAATDCLVYVITRDGFERILRQRPAVGHQLSLVVAERRLGMSQALANASPAHRLAETQLLARQILDKMLVYFGLGRSD
jgi:small-conductance mechanosensitive channel/CRP-like cAMP-binding protein